MIWRTPEDKTQGNTPLIIVECKSDNVPIKNVSIKTEDYRQGDNYARIALAPFVITHNSSETRFWRVMKEKMPGYLQEIGAVPKAGDSPQRNRANRLETQGFQGRRLRQTAEQMPRHHSQPRPSRSRRRVR